MSRAGSLCKKTRHLSQMQQSQLCDYMTTEPARMEISKQSRLPGGPANEPSEKQDSG